MGDIGYQDGIQAFENWYRKLSAAIDQHNTWVAEWQAWSKLPDDVKKFTDPPSPPTLPKIPLEGPNFQEADMTTWPWPKKFFDNTMRKLKDDHDAANPSDPPDPPNGGNGGTTPAPWDSGYAPQAYNQGSRGQNAIFNVRINCTFRQDGKYVDKNGIVYSDSGLCDGGRTEADVPGLKDADMKDQKEPWDSYEWFGKTIGPDKEDYPAESYNK